MLWLILILILILISLDSFKKRIKKKEPILRPVLILLSPFGVKCAVFVA